MMITISDRHRKKKITHRLLLAGLALILIILLSIIPVGAAADCNDWQHNYTTCLNTYPSSPSMCACCVISSSCTLGINCPCSNNLSQCEKPIGLLIYKSAVTVTNSSSGFPIIHSTFDECDCCSVGILARTTPESSMNTVNITNMTVKKWANGIMLWRVTNGRVSNSTCLDNGNGIYLFNSESNTINSNYIWNSSIYGIFLETSKPAANEKSRYNKITNNWFNNSVDWEFISGFSFIWSNTWNTTQTSGRNILGSLGRNYTGGNYWEQTCSKEPGCSCNPSTGFCRNNCILETNDPNIDYLPLCIPPPDYLELKIDHNITNWILNIGPNYNGFSLEVNTSYETWDVTVSDGEYPSKPHEGYLVRHNSTGYDPLINLSTLLDINASSAPYITLLSNTSLIDGSGSGEESYPIGLRQIVTMNDKILSLGDTYRVVIKFTGTPGLTGG